MLVLNPLIGTLIVVLAMLIPALIIYLLYVSFRYEAFSEGSEKRKIYGCGEEVQPIQASVSIENLLWIAIKKSMKSLYTYVREVMHSGVMNDWLVYMFSYFSLLIIILVIMVFTMRWWA